MLKEFLKRRTKVVLGVFEIVCFFFFYFITIFFSDKLMKFTGLDLISTPIGTDQIKIDPRFILIRVVYFIGTLLYMFLNVKDNLIIPNYKGIESYLGSINIF